MQTPLNDAPINESRLARPRLRIRQIGFILHLMPWRRLLLTWVFTFAHGFVLLVFAMVIFLLTILVRHSASNSLSCSNQCFRFRNNSGLLIRRGAIRRYPIPNECAHAADGF